jgi:hypothetical protein
MHRMPRQPRELLKMLDRFKRPMLLAALNDPLRMSDAQAFDLAEAETHGWAVLAPSGFVGINVATN